MSELGTQAIPGALVGTDAALATSLQSPIVEVVMGGDVGGSAPTHTVTREAIQSRAAAVIARMSAAKDSAPTGADTPANDPAPAGDQPPGDGSAPPSGVTPSDAPPTDTTDAPPADDKPPEAKPDPVESAAVAAELAQARAEAALLRSQLDRGGAPTSEQRAAYVADPIATIREAIASRLGVAAESKDVDDEIEFLRQELTFSAIGVENLEDARRLQRSQEHTDRRWRLGQKIQAASQETEQKTAPRKAALSLVSSAIDAAKADYPYLAMAEVDGVNAADVALDLWTAEVRAGRIKPGDTDADDARAALRLANDFFKHRADRIYKIRPVDIPTDTATAPANAAAVAKQPATASQQPSKAPPAKAAVTPTTLSAKQAAAAPAAKPDDSPRVIVDPHSPESRAARLAAAAKELDKRASARK